MGQITSLASEMLHRGRLIIIPWPGVQVPPQLLASKASSPDFSHKLGRSLKRFSHFHSATTQSVKKTGANVYSQEIKIKAINALKSGFSPEVLSPILDIPEIELKRWLKRAVRIGSPNRAVRPLKAKSKPEDLEIFHDYLRVMLS